MITILKGKEITVEWKVVSLDTKQPVDFEGVNAKVFLLAPDNIYTLPFDVVRDDFRGLRMTIPTGYISTGAYDIKVIWLKDALKDKPVYRNVSVKREVFALTDEASEVTYEGDTIKIATGVESCGRDGLSAYEIAVFRGFAKESSEKEWVESLDNVLASEESRVKAEEERVEAEKERVEAEDEREGAEDIRIRIFTNGEEDRRQSFEISQSSRADAFDDSEAQRQSIFESKEAQRDNNENSRMVKEEQRKIAESSRKSSEQGRETAESGRVSAESTRVADENIRKANEQDRVDAEKNRVNAETSRANAEVARANTENTRKSNEQARVSAENGRVSAEAAREAAEGVREATFQANEAIRQENETSRQDAEVIREENEMRRQEAETIREATYKNKVDRDDNAPKLTAGFANNLVGRGEATPQEISFRPSGGDTSIEDGTARIERLKGSTMVWNQRCNGLLTGWSATGMTMTSEMDNLSFAKIDDTSICIFRHGGQSMQIIEGHKYLLLLDFTSTQSNAYCNIIIYDSGFKGYLYGVWRDDKGAAIFSEGRATGTADRTTYDVKADNGCVITVNGESLYDLTKMFGAGNEPTTIEEFHARKPIGIDEYAYNEGELISTNVEEIKSVGFNAWDEEWEVGSIYPATGIDQESTSTIRSKNYNRMLPNTKYCINSKNGMTMAIILYNKDKKFIDYWTNTNLREITTTSDTRFFRVMTYSGYGTTYNNDICIHLAHTGYRNGEYEPYKEFRRGIPIKDIKDKDGNQLFPNGLLSAGSVYDEITPTKAIKRIGVVDMGTLTWVYDTAYTSYNFYADVRNYGFAGESKDTIKPNILNSLYATSTRVGSDKDTDKTIKLYANLTLRLKDTSYTDADTFKAAMIGVMLYYELAEPIEVDLPEPLNLDYEVSDFGTEEVISDVPTTPMKADIIYQFNAVDRIRDNSRHTAESVELLNAKADKTTVEAAINELTNAIPEVVNDLTTGGADKALSAEMGKEISEKVGYDEYSYNLGASTASQTAVTINFENKEDFHIHFKSIIGDKWRIVINKKEGSPLYINPVDFARYGLTPSIIDPDNVGVSSIRLYMQASDSDGSISFSISYNLKLNIDVVKEEMESKIGKMFLDKEVGDVLAVGLDYNVVSTPNMVAIDQNSILNKDINLFNPSAKHHIYSGVVFKDTTGKLIQTPDSVNKGFVLILGKPLTGLNRVQLFTDFDTTGISRMMLFTVNEIPESLDGVSPVERGLASSTEKRCYMTPTIDAKYLAVLVMFSDATNYNIDIIDGIVQTLGGSWKTEYIPYDSTKINYIATVQLPEKIEKLPQLVESKLDKNQGVQNATKQLVVGDDGNVTLKDALDVDTDVTACVRAKNTTTLNLGDNLISNIVGAGTNWNHADGTYTHNTGSAEPLTFDYNTVVGKAYVAILYTGTSSFAEHYINVSIGDGELCDIYKGTTGPYYIGIISTGGKLKITPSSNFDSYVYSVELREIVTADNAVMTYDYPNLNVNINSGDDITGFWNIAIGAANVMQKLQNGSRNIAIGNNSLSTMVSGERNIAIGTFALNQLKHGVRNIAIGADALYRSTYSNSNVAIGKAAAGFTHADPTAHKYDYNVAVGYNALGAIAKDYNNNVAIGAKAMGGSVSDTTNRNGNVAVGYEAGYYAGENNVSVGKSSNRYTEGNNNVSIGANTGDVTETGSDNILIGSNAKILSGEGTWQNKAEHNNTIVIGANAIAKKSNQVVIGNVQQTEVILLGNKRIIFNTDGTVTWESV